MINYIGEYHESFATRAQAYTDDLPFLEGNHDVIWPKSSMRGGFVVRWRYIEEQGTLYWISSEPHVVDQDTKYSVREYLEERKHRIDRETGFNAYLRIHEAMSIRLNKKSQ